MLKQCQRIGRFWIALGLVLLFLWQSAPVYSQQSSTAPSQPQGAPVILGVETVVTIEANLGAYSASERAQAIAEKLTQVANNRSIPPESIRIAPSTADEQSLVIIAGEKQLGLMTVTEKDAKAAKQPLNQLAQNYVQAFQKAIQHYRQKRSLQYLLLTVVYTILATVGFTLVWNLVGRMFLWLQVKLKSWRVTLPESLRTGSLQLLPTGPLIELLARLLSWVRLTVYFGVIYLYVSLVLSFLPWTENFGRVFLTYLFSSVNTALREIIAYLPNLFFIIIIIIITREIVGFVKLLFNEIERGNLLPWFYPDWIKPTYRLVFFVILALAAAIGLPYLPGFKSPAFQGVSLILGALFTLGSTGAVSNIIGGIIVIYARSFQIGDRVQIGDTIGEIIDRNLIVTRIRTPKNVVVTIPNATVFSSNIVNFSTLVREPEQGKGLILNTTITLGYDVPWRQVHAALIKAALMTEGILKEPLPFVLQTSLNDFHVSYELNAYTAQPTRVHHIYSELHQNIQDQCNSVGIEILSPSYLAMRDGNHSTIPGNYLPDDYQAPGFRIE